MLESSDTLLIGVQLLLVISHLSSLFFPQKSSTLVLLNFEHSSDFCNQAAATREVSALKLTLEALSCNSLSPSKPLFHLLISFPSHFFSGLL
jgi:hypothetical protein